MAYVLSGPALGPRISYNPRLAAAHAARVVADAQRLQNLVIRRAITLPPTPEEMARAYWGTTGHPNIGVYEIK